MTTQRAVDPTTLLGLGDGVTSLTQIRTGFTWSLPRVHETNRWLRWYNNEFDSLWRSAPANIINALEIMERRDLIRLPIFEISSKFYQDAILSNETAVDTEHEPLRDWLAENRVDIFRAIGKALEYWSITGRFILMTTDAGEVRPVWPANHVFIVDPADADKVIGHNLVYLAWSEESPNAQVPPKRTDERPADRLIVHRIREEQGVLSTRDMYTYAGAESGVIGSPIEDATLTRSNLRAVYYAGNGQGFYGGLRDPALQACIRLTLLQRSLNRNADPHFFVPDSIGDAEIVRRRVFPTTDVPDPDLPPPTTLGATPSLREQFLEGRGMLIQITPEDAGTWGYQTYDPQVQGQLDVIQWLFQTIYSISGVPPSAYGVNIGRGESGEARKAAMQRAAQLINEIRGEIQRIFGLVIRDMGAPIPPGQRPQEAVSIVWPESPFEDTATAIQTLLALEERGIVTPEEIRAGAHFPALTEQQQERIEQGRQERSLMGRMRDAVFGGNNNAQSSDSPSARPDAGTRTDRRQ